MKGVSVCLFVCHTVNCIFVGVLFSLDYVTLDLY